MIEASRGALRWNGCKARLWYNKSNLRLSGNDQITWRVEPFNLHILEPCLLQERLVF
jgi:hypothetical protein